MNMLAVDQRTSFVKALKKTFPKVTKSLVKEVKEDIIKVTDKQIEDYLNSWGKSDG